MGFIEWVPPAKEKCGHTMPSSNEKKAFNVGTKWRCDICGAAYEFVGVDYGDQRDPYVADKWERRIKLDGEDTRNVAQPPSGYRGIVPR